MKLYTAPEPSLWIGRTDGAGAERFHEIIQFKDLGSKIELQDLKGATGIIGFGSDEGIRRNQGRIGAAEGPKELRRALAKLPIHGSLTGQLFDLGDVNPLNHDLESSQQALADVVAQLLKAGGFSLVLGGGHEVAWGHYQGIAATHPNKRIGIVNFDAHLDLRSPLPGEKGTSGSSFQQIATTRQAAGQRFDYLCMGVQPFANTPSLYAKAESLGAILVSAEAIQNDLRGRVIAQLDQLLSVSDVVYVTICMDVFAAAFAPGVSAPQPLGLFPNQLLPLLRYLMGSRKVVALDIAEVSPPNDRDQMTAALGAVLIAETLQAK